MNKLEQLKDMTVVVADTGDLKAIKQYLPQDATTNPSLLLKVAKDSDYSPILTRSMQAAKGDVADAVDRFGVERLSFDTDATIEKAKKLMALYKSNGIGADRVLIKIASTWEGIQAAAELEKQGINCVGN